MKKSLVFLILLLGLVGCKLMAKEIKKTKIVREAAKEVCDCKTVSVTSDYSGSSSLTMTIKNSKAEDLEVNADSILLNVKKAFPKICNYDEVFIIYEGDDFNERFTYYGCDMNATRDTLHYNTYENDEFQELDDLFETEESDIQHRVKEAEQGS